MSVQTPEVRRKHVSARAVLLFALVAAFVLFGVENLTPTPVWPFRGELPVFVVILIAFVLGAGVGWLGKGLLGRRQATAARGIGAER